MVINTLDELKHIIQQERQRGKTIVTTNGCFDIIHVGHVRYLKKAKQLGDILIVGINSDTSVRQIKGETRPVNSQNDRAEVLASLDCVDYTFIFNEDTPVAFLKELKPDIHVKGGDYSPDKMIERETVEANNGKIVIVDLEKGYSTSNILEQAFNSKKKAASE